MADIPGNTTTTATVTVGSTTTGDLETLGDQDWFAITLTAGQQITVTVDALSSHDPNPSNPFDTYLNIYDSTGNTILFSNDDINEGIDTNSQVSFAAPYSGTYYIDVGAFQNSSYGTYQLSVQPYTPPPLATNDQIADQLVSGYWGGDSHHWAVTQGGTITVNISTLNASEKTLARAALQEWSDIIGVHFQEVTSGGQIVFDDTEQSSGGPIAATDANWSNGIISHAHVHISTSWVNTYGTSLYSYSFQTYIHEIGHALGLGHAGDYNNTATYPYDALFENDAWSTSIMSYFDQHENTYFGNQGFTVNFAVTPMVADILAMQTLYGLSTTTRTGNTTYGYNATSDTAGTVFDAGAYPRAAFTIFDSGGNDTIDYSGSVASQLINLNPETFSNVNGYVGNLSIARGVVIENAIGGNGSDTLIGNSANNVLKGNLGADTLTGGGGSDTFLDTEAGHNGDTITDFSAGDIIVFNDATLSTFTFSLSGHTLNFTGGSLTLTNVPTGTFVASAAPGGGVQLAIAAGTTPHVTVQNDFNGDGRSDFLLQDSNSGWTTDWLGTSSGGFTNNGANASIQFASNWHVVGTGDFNGDGRADYLLKSDAGWVTDWLGTANGGFSNNGANASIFFASNWQIAGTGDFNGDGRTDFLVRDTTNGWLTEWTGNANGGFTNNGANSTEFFSSDWHVVGTGDFNGDGIDDFLLRSDAGWVTDWLGTSTGGFTNNGANTSIFFTSDWHIIGTGDFNGDGRTDILLRSDAGWVTDWLGTANGGFTNNGANASIFLTSDWHIASIGDFNGDGRSDILLRSDAGWTTDWLGTPSGGFSNNGTNFSTFIATNWHVQDPSVHLI